MATISSTGIGSGLDVNSIVSQLVALEKKPLKALQAKATIVQGQISAFGQIQSQISAFKDVVTKISAPTVWGARNASSSNASAATITATATANAGSISVDVDALAQHQSLSSVAQPPGTMPGAGTLVLQLGAWGAGGSTFTPGATSSVDLAIAATDTMSTIATKINAANSGVVATVFNDGTNERLLLQAKDAGAAAGFRLQSADPALAGLVFDPQNKAGTGMNAAGIPVQYGQDAKARINGLAVTSPTNTLTNNIPGVTITLVSTTTTGYGTGSEVKAPVSMRISEDVTLAVRNVNDFVSAYNTLSKTLTDLTKYEAATKTGAAFQGDPTIVGVQNVLKRMLASTSQGGVYQRLSEVGIEMQLDGTLTMNTTKLSKAANNGTALQQLFTTNNANSLTNGFALKFAELGSGILGSGGAAANKSSALQSALDRNAKEQTKVNDRATLVETQLRQRYSVLDGKMGSLSALSAYVSQQATLWNKSGG